VKQELLFDDTVENRIEAFFGLSTSYRPCRIPYFSPQRIILTKGSDTTPARRDFVQQICAVHPEAEVVERLDTSHCRIDLQRESLLERHYVGKQTLVFGELNSAVRFSEERGNMCPNYWHFSPYGFCPYDCQYCYLAGTPGVKFSPTVKIYVNLPEMLRKIERVATKQAKPTAFYLGKLQDGLAMDPLTGYSRTMIPFFAAHEFARLVLLTKSDHVDNLLDLNHNGRTILSWSLNPASMCQKYEPNTPALERRLQAMEECVTAGYPVRAVIMPVIPVPSWQDVYGRFIADLLHRIPLQRLTVGGICSYRAARDLMNAKLSPDNLINRNMMPKSVDGRMRYPPDLRMEMYMFLLEEIRRHRSDLPLALCLEESDIWKQLHLSDSVGKCNCVL